MSTDDQANPQICAVLIVNPVAMIALSRWNIRTIQMLRPQICKSSRRKCFNSIISLIRTDFVDAFSVKHGGRVVASIWERSIRESGHE